MFFFEKESYYFAKKNLSPCFCDEEDCKAEVLLKSGKCYECFIKAVTNPIIYRKWMIDYVYSFRKLRDPDTTMEVIEKERIKCEYCGDSVSMIIDKLGLLSLHEGIIEPTSKFTSEFHEVRKKHFVFRIDIGDCWWMTHCMIVVGDYLLHSYYGIFPFRVTKIDKQLEYYIDTNNFNAILGFDNHGKDETIIYGIP
jgi:hypothetical protein